MPYHVRDERQPVCAKCGKPMSEWRASDECPGVKDENSKNLQRKSGTGNEPVHPLQRSST